MMVAWKRHCRKPGFTRPCESPATMPQQVALRVLQLPAGRHQQIPHMQNVLFKHPLGLATYQALTLINWKISTLLSVSDRCGNRPPSQSPCRPLGRQYKVCSSRLLIGNSCGNVLNCRNEQQARSGGRVHSLPKAKR